MIFKYLFNPLLALLEIRFIRNTTWFVNNHLLPLLNTPPEIRDSVLWADYVVELDNIGWQYVIYIDNKDALTNAAA